MPSSTYIARLHVIEMQAQVGRDAAATRLADLGLTFALDTDMQVVATVLTGGPVESCPNLAVAGERMAGLLEAKTSRILFEHYDPPVRQRFSIAHELGHFYLDMGTGKSGHHHCGMDRVDSEAASLEEVLDPETEADAFAGAFLMPHALLAADCAHFGSCIPFMAVRYGVSEATVRRRMRTLKWLAQ